MGIFIWLNNMFKKINNVYFSLNGNIKEIERVYTFINGERKLIHPAPETLVYEQTTPGTYTYNILPGKYRVEVAGSGGNEGSSASVPDKQITAGNGQLSTQEITIENKIELSVIVAGKVPGQSVWKGDFGAVSGGDGGLGYAGSVLRCAGGGGGAQSRVLQASIGVNVTADGGGGIFRYSGSGVNAVGGNGSNGALGGQSRESMNGANAGNGLGGAGAQIGPDGTVQKGDGWVKIYLIG